VSSIGQRNWADHKYMGMLWNGEKDPKLLNILEELRNLGKMTLEAEMLQEKYIYKMSSI
jgi:hypothetical protein